MARKPTAVPADNSEQPALAAPATLTVTIQGIHFPASAPYSEGHVLTALEASALNQLRMENLRNNFSSRVKAAFEAVHKSEKEAGVAPEALSKELPGEAIEKLRTDFAAYDAEYTFAARGTRVSLDPVEAEAIRLARGMLSDALAKAKIDRKSLPDGQFDTLLKQLLDSKPEIRNIAARRVEERKALAGASLGFDFGSVSTPAEGSAEGEAEGTKQAAD